MGGVVVTLVLNILLIPIIEYEGAAWAALACYAFMALMSFGVGKKYYPIPYPIGRMLLYIGLAVGAYFLSVYARPLVEGSLVYIIGLNTVILLFFLGIIYFLEKKTIRSFF